MAIEIQYRPQNPITLKKCGQKLSESGKIRTGKKSLILRTCTITGLILTMVFTIMEGLKLSDPFVVYSTLMPFDTFLTITLAWFFYKSPNNGIIGNDLVSVIIPVYNQKSMIEIVIDAVFKTTYRNIEVIVVNDGSNDGTKEILDKLAKKYLNLRVIHKKNEGKRRAVAAGFYASTGGYVVLIDSDSIVDKYAISEFMKTFKADSKIGAAVGHVKVWNAETNIITKCQDAWYDFSFNIGKAAESVFGCVTCCSGCLAAYRRETISDFIPYWAEAKVQSSDDREMTMFVISPSKVKSELRLIFGDKFWVPLSQKLMESMSQYDDSEDRGLTAKALLSWKSVYVASALVYTDAPENLRGFIKQQIRWKKGYLRTNFFVNSFFWRKNPLIALKYYTEFMTAFTAPLITFTLLFYEPIFLQNPLLTASVFGSSLLVGLAQGIDYKMRDPVAKNWKYKPLMDLIAFHMLSWLLFPVLWGFRDHKWGTR
ncbi:MAG TPA: glycosyltransferase family 2 protein [Candidatus Nitrosotalea sp.]|nr:glycosyltransferase family 2 protein [Candidatus Nitrosotalea sp.]